MTPDSASIWTSIYLSLCGLALHAFVLWRDAVAGGLRTRLLELEIELISNRPAGEAPAAALRLLRLLRDSRASAAELTYSRLLAAKTLLQEGSTNNLATEIQSIPDQKWRDRSIHVFEEWEKAVVTRMTVGSPILWVLFVLSWNRKDGMANLSNPALLEATLAVTAMDGEVSA